MKKLIREIRKKLRFWLGIEEIQSEVWGTGNSVDNLVADLSQLKTQLENQITMGVDVGFHEPTAIIIVSRLGNGHVEIIDTHITNYNALKEIIRTLKDYYGIKKVVKDMPFVPPGSCSLL